MKEKIQRKFKMADVKFLKRAQAQKDAVELRLADFTKRLPWLDATWLDAYQAQLDDISKYKTDWSTVKNIAAVSKDVKNTLAEASRRLRRLYKYCPIAFGDDNATMKSFGQERLTRARQDRMEMISLLGFTYERASKASYKSALLNVGYTQDALDGLLATKQQLAVKAVEMNDEKTGRPLTTSERVKRLNEIYENVIMLSKCAKIVYAKNPEMIKLFSLRG